jgi:outer membrane usher protein FimD/PapC
MRRTILIAASLALMFAGVAYAAVSYKTGKYQAGSTDGVGVTMRIKHGKFDVSRVSLRRKCESSDNSFHDRFTFTKGPGAKLAGKINHKGRLSGRYKSSEGTVTVKGKIKGSKATVTASEHATYTPDYSTAQYDCRGSHTFHAKRVK